MSRPIFILLLVAAVLCSCESSAKKKAKKDEEALRNQQLGTANLAVVDSDLMAVEASVDKGLAMLGENPPDVNGAKSELKHAKGGLGKAIPGVRIADKQFTQLKKDFWTEKKRADSAQDVNDAQLMTWTLRGMVIGTGMVIVGVLFAAFASKIPGVPEGAGGAVTMAGWLLGGISYGVRLFNQSTAQYRWIAGLVFTLTIAAVVVAYGIKAVKASRTKKKAVELVATGQALLADPRVPDEVFYEAAAKTQSPATTKFVREVKAKVLVDDAAGVAAQKVLDEATPTSG